MAATLTLLIGGLLFLYTLAKLISLTRFYINARRTGFPVYVSLFPSKNIAWMVITPILQPFLEKNLPEQFYARLDLAIYGWEYRRKAEIHRKLGKTFVLVTLDECTLWVADPALAHVILQRRKEFLQPPIVGNVMGVFGSNVVVTNGADWQRQRRMVAPNLNEGISEIVWKESCQQAQTRTGYLIQYPGSATLSGLRCLAINVLGVAGYGQKQSWAPDFQSLDWNIEDGKGAYFKTITLVAEMLLATALVPSGLLKMWFMPSRFQMLGRYKEKMPEYTKAILDMERHREGEGKSFLSMLVKCSDEAKGSGSSGLFLTEDEISGNLFIFSIAGFETTANTMGYAVMFLTIYPEWQGWMRDELQHLPLDVSTWNYEEAFPRCKRTMAVMFETLRLFTSVMHASRSVAEPQQLADVTTSHSLLPPMEIFVAMQSMHTNPDIWGSDCMEFRPSRWLDSNDQLITPPKGTFMPWSGGPRICPGMKMAQVEFVASIAVLIRSAWCEPIVEGSEDLEGSRVRLRELMNDSMASVALQVNSPEKVRLRWTRIQDCKYKNR